MARLSKEERAALEAKLAEDDKAAEDDEPETEYEIGRGENYARVSSKSKAGRKVHTFFKESFGIDLDDEPVQDDAADEDEDGKEAGKRKAAGRQQQGGQVRAFRGRGVG